jgi:hypothetical protein
MAQLAILRIVSSAPYCAQFDDKCADGTVSVKDIRLDSRLYVGVYSAVF